MRIMGPFFFSQRNMVVLKEPKPWSTYGTRANKWPNIGNSNINKLEIFTFYSYGIQKAQIKMRRNLLSITNNNNQAWIQQHSSSKYACLYA